MHRQCFPHTADAKALPENRSDRLVSILLVSGYRVNTYI